MLNQSRRKEFLKLIRKFTQGKASPEEIDFLEKYYTYFEKEAGITDQITESEREILQSEMLQAIRNRTNGAPKTISIYRKSWFQFAAAAVALLCISITILTFRNNKPVDEINQVVEIPKSMVKEKPLYKNDVKPGGNKATLTLADGTKIILDNAAEGALTRQGNTTVIKLDKGKLAYNMQTVGQIPSKAILYNTLSTPRGGQYIVKLPDGTTVWLNASSSLKFPTAFSGNERKVERKGEAYFEVAKNEAMPFIVSAGNSEVKVLGTHFNVSAYAEDKVLKTTLLEGSVEFTVVGKGKTGDESSVIKLQPGQQAQLDGANTLTVVEADTEEAVAWKNGFFIFNNEEMESIMQKIARWYDVIVIYDVDNEHMLVTGNISRAQNVSEVLRLLELTEKVHFKIEGKTVTVLP